MHDDEHHSGSSQVVKIGRQQECDKCYTPQQALWVASAYPLCDEIEAAVIAKQFDNRHRSQEKEHYGSCPTYIV